MSINNVNEIDNYDIFRQNIKYIILNDEALFRLIYFPFSDCLDADKHPYVEDPFTVFKENEINNHGVVLFKDKSDAIQNTENVLVVVSLNSTLVENTKCIHDVEIRIKIILKGREIQFLSDNGNRSYKIAKLLDDNIQALETDNGGEIKRKSFSKLTLNENNCGHELVYTCKNFSYDKEIQIYTHNSKVDSYGITREYYTLLTTPIKPVISPFLNLYNKQDDGTYDAIVAYIDVATLVEMQTPTNESKNGTDYGYELEITKRMFCSVIDEINESTIIKYNNKYYKIDKILEYDDYKDCTLKLTEKLVVK